MARYLFDSWDEAALRLGSGRIALFLDYDGTLAPIRKRPGLARPAARTRLLLRRIQRHLEVVIISGRSLADLKKMLKVRGVVYSGNHGLEISGRGFHFVHPSAPEFRKAIARICRSLGRSFRGIDGVWIENKKYTASIHYREAGSSAVKRAKRELARQAGFLEEMKVDVKNGKKVWELRPRVRWDKGAAVSLMLRKFSSGEKRNFFPVYIGDDETDESAFRALKQTGLTVKVDETGRVPTAARYYVRSSGEVFRLLSELAALSLCPALPGRKHEQP